MFCDILINFEENMVLYFFFKIFFVIFLKLFLWIRLGNICEIWEVRELVKLLNFGEDIDMRKGWLEWNVKLSKKKIGKEKVDCVVK